MTMTTMPDARQFALLNRFQRAFPILPRPFAALAAQLDMSEEEVIGTLRDLRASGLLSRVGAVFRPNVVGVSALAALAVAPERLDEVARHVSARPEVNHNYEREHHFNLWFVVTAGDDQRLRAALDAIEQACGCGPALILPMLQEYHIDLGFNLAPDTRLAPDPRLAPDARPAPNTGAERANNAGPAPDEYTISPRARPAPAAVLLNADERALIGAIQDGLPLVERPFAALGCSEADAMATLARWVDDGVIKRFGVIVRHQELGFTDNAMVVWNVPDGEVDRVGERIAASGLVTLCYRRPRQLPRWDYSLFCMLHGKDRREVEARIVTLAARCELDAYPHAILFSRRRFKQRGARYTHLPELEHGRP